VANMALVGATAIEAGVGSCSGLAAIDEKGDSRLAQTRLTDSGSIQIVSLRDAIRRMGGAVDLLKLDCEGAEWDILKDVEGFRRVGLVRMEYHLTDGRSLDDLTMQATRLGFCIERLEPNDGFGIAWLSRVGA